MRLFLPLLLAAFAAFPAQAEVKVVTSIAPLGGIAAAVMQGAGAPEVLIKGNASPHTYQMKPSDARLLAQADLILWVGPGLEAFLDHVLDENPKAMALAGETLDPDTQPEGMEIVYYLNRKGGAWEPEAEEHEEHEAHAAHGEEHHHHDHGAYDPHLWLNPANAVAIAKRLAAKLSELDPAHADVYANNANGFAHRLAREAADICSNLAPYKDRGFIVFHDAYQYFERSCGLSGQGSISLSPEVPPSAKRLADLQARVKAQQVVCVFAEPQFKDTLVKALVAGTSAKTGVLNVDASDLPLGPEMYFTYLQRVNNAFADCLKP